MSLLLDALKKNGSAHQAGENGHTAPGKLTEMTLEELPNKPGYDKPVFDNKPSHAAPTPSGSPTSDTSVIAAKKAPARKQFHYNLGIVPTTLIMGLLLGTAGGIYVWVKIQPPKIAQRSSQTHAVAAYTAPAPRPMAPLVLTPETMPAAETQAQAARPAPAQKRTARYTNVRRAPGAPSAPGIQIERTLENDSIYTTLTAAYKAYQSGDLGTAWQRYREVLQSDAKNRDALLGMAAIAQQQGQDDAAIQYYRQVLLLDPRDPVAHAGMSAFSSGDAAGKESHLKHSLAQSPQSAALHFALGNIYTEQSRWGDAQQAYFNAFRLEPANAQFAFNLATSLDHLGKAKLAAQYYGQALQIDTSGNSGFDRVQTQQRMNKLLAP
ncbi:MAG TPA: tetratricopeptide repeat protein [Gallionellaceae bacterium]|nr:tetratricopeptide repeat protein [Gallionellaceae bacterium]